MKKIPFLTISQKISFLKIKLIEKSEHFYFTVYSNHWPLTMQSIASALFGGGSKEEKTDGGTGKS